MADGIGRIMGGRSYIGNGFVNTRKEDVQKEAQAQAPEIKQEAVDPNKVMDFLANNLLPVKPESKMVELAPDVAARAAESMASLERFISVASDEVGKDLALVLADEYSARFVK